MKQSKIFITRRHKIALNEVIKLNSLALSPSQVERKRPGTHSYKPGTTVLCYEEELPSPPNQPTTLQVLRGPPSDTEGSSNSESSHETGDSGRYSHDETEMANLSSGPGSRPPSLRAEESDGSDCCLAQESGQESELKNQGHRDLKLGESTEKGCPQSALSL